MSVKLKVVTAFALGVAGGVFAGCQTYDFEPVQPLAVAQTTQTKTVISKQLKPNLMLLVDKSGSMNFAANDQISPCTARCNEPGQPQCAAGCATRWQELKSAMNTFLTQSGDIARMGFVPYPADTVCTAPTLAQIGTLGVPLSESADVASELRATAEAINQKLAGITVGGGTPTGSSLTMLGSYDRLRTEEREDFILLLTDGLPNCNQSNNPATCRCTASGTTCSNILCLDKDATVAAVSSLKAAGIRTVVVGFGAETASGDGPEVLQAMALAGGFPRGCPNGTDAECAPGTCIQTSKTCSIGFYQAKSGAELAEALRQISERILVGDPCEYNLDASPSDPNFLTVLIDGVSTPSGSGTWTYTAPAKVNFHGDLCRKLTEATPASPVKVEFRIVEGL